jgi:hypothetical protein
MGFLRLAACMGATLVSHRFVQIPRDLLWFRSCWLCYFRYSRIFRPRFNLSRRFWLTGATGLDILKPAANDVLQCWPVSRRVNSSRAPDDDASLIEAVAVSEGGDVQLLV